MGWRPLAVSIIGFLAGGCTVSAVDLRDNLDLNQATFQEKHAGHPPIALDAFARLMRDAFRAEPEVTSEVERRSVAAASSAPRTGASPPAGKPPQV